MVSAIEEYVSENRTKKAEIAVIAGDQTTLKQGPHRGDQVLIHFNGPIITTAIALKAGAVANQLTWRVKKLKNRREGSRGSG